MATNQFSEKCKDLRLVYDAKVEPRIERIPEAGCWLWVGCVDDTGHARIYVGNYKYMLIHRLAYLIFVGNIPHNKIVHHTCEVPCCVNPYHLALMGRREHKMHHMGWSETHCPLGHILDGENTYLRPNGTRYCRVCHRQRERSRRNAK